MLGHPKRNQQKHSIDKMSLDYHSFGTLVSESLLQEEKYETAEPWRNREILTKKNSVGNYFCSTAICY